MKTDPLDAFYRSLSEKFGDHLLRIVYKRYSELSDIAKEIVHEVIHKVAERLKAGAEIGNARGYLIKALIHDCNRRSKKQKDTISLTGLESIPNDTNPILEDFAESLGLPRNAHKLDICLALANRLNEPCRSILLLFLEGKSMKEIAQAVGMGDRSVISKKSQCIKNHLKPLISRL